MSDKENKGAIITNIKIPPQKYFDLAHQPKLFDRTALGLDLWHDDPWWKLKKNGQVVQVVAVDAGESRPPLKGEWFLSSGEIVLAYRAEADLSKVRQIAKLVCVKRVVKWEEV